MSVWTRVGSAVAGIALATAVVIGLFAIHGTWFGGALLNPDWINGLAASVLGVALVFSWLERAPCLRRRLPRPVAIALATTLVVLSLGVYMALGDVQFPYHRWDQFHYYIGAKYLPELDYRDLDVLTAGPVVNELSGDFDQFWNSEWAVPVEATVRDLPTQDQVRAEMTRLHERVAATGYPYPIYDDAADLRARLIRVRDRFVWARGHAFVEKPSRVADPDAPRVIGALLVERASKVKHELLIESPYFVLDQGQIQRLRELKARGVTVRALTNSAASNDVLPAQAGYAKTRMKLLQAGLDLYELRPDSGMTRRWSLRAAGSLAALHAKTGVYDRESVWIGSFNLDPRSQTINTEIGVMIDSPEIAGQVAESMDEAVRAGSAYHVTLDERGKLLWTAENDGKVVQYHADPGTTLWQRFKLGFVGLLPIESQI